MNAKRILTLLAIVAVLFLSGCVAPPYYGGTGYYSGVGVRAATDTNVHFTAIKESLAVIDTSAVHTVQLGIEVMVMHAEAAIIEAIVLDTAVAVIEDIASVNVVVAIEVVMVVVTEAAVTEAVVIVKEYILKINAFLLLLTKSN